MRCLITCGPTYENVDQVRRLTNFSTGQLGIGLANHLASARHEVTLLKGYYAICPESCSVAPITFTTTENLLERFRAAARERYDAIFHAAAVSEFSVGGVFRKDANGELESVISGKFGTRDGNLFAELVPTPKLISHLRDLFPAAKIFGWKYELEGTREEVIALGQKQIRENRTNYSVVNGTAYGRGFGIVSADRPVEHCSDRDALYRSLLALAVG